MIVRDLRLVRPYDLILKVWRRPRFPNQGTLWPLHLGHSLANPASSRRLQRKPRFFADSVRWRQHTHESLPPSLWIFLLALDVTRSYWEITAGTQSYTESPPATWKNSVALCLVGSGRGGGGAGRRASRAEWCLPAPRNLILPPIPLPCKSSHSPLTPAAGKLGPP